MAKNTSKTATSEAATTSETPAAPATPTSAPEASATPTTEKSPSGHALALKYAANKELKFKDAFVQAKAENPAIKETSYRTAFYTARKELGLSTVRAKHRGRPKGTIVNKGRKIGSATTITSASGGKVNNMSPYAKQIALNAIENEIKNLQNARAEFMS